jgi:hypothetical protein
MDQRQCPSCHGTKLIDGSLGVYKHTFIPADRAMFLGYVAKAFVCLNCGFLGHYLEPDDIHDIHRNLDIYRNLEP